MTIVCDLDGTVSDHSARFHYVTTDKPRNYDRYYEELANDPPLPGAKLHLARLVAMASPDFYFLTGRPERYRTSTVLWLHDHFSLSACGPEAPIYMSNEARLVMRPDGDFRKASIFKEELVQTLNLNHDLIFIDDDVRNAEMYSKYGLFLKAPECWEVMR